MTNKDREIFKIPILEQPKQRGKKSKLVKEKFVLSPKRQLKKKRKRHIRRPLSSSTGEEEEEAEDQLAEESPERAARISTVRRDVLPQNTSNLPRFRPKSVLQEPARYISWDTK